jgi:uncharacterized membrane protein (UPF0127 family)
MMLLVVGAAVFLIMSQMHSTTNLYLGDGVFDARVAKNEADRAQGLSGVTKLGPKEALIMAFPGDDTWKIWMKDMKIPIDIVWLDKDKKVVYSVKNASPDGSTDVIFTPTSPARYVVELPMGTVDQQNIRTGQAGVFDIAQEEVK